MLKYIKRGLLIFLISIIVVPYLIPLSKAGSIQMPYENSHLYESETSTLHYRLYKPTDSDILGKILLVHGLGGSTFSYEKNAPILAEAGYYVVTIDLPGFGYSSRNTQENHDQLNRAQLAWDLLDEVDQNLDSDFTSLPWHLGGHSMGGGTVSAMAFLRQQSTASLILIDGALFETNRSNSFVTLPVVSRWLQVILEHYLIKPKQFEKFLTSAYGKPPTSEDILGYYEPLSTDGTARSSIALLKTAKNIPSENLTQLKMPVLAIWGEKDTWVPLSETEKIKDKMPQTLLKTINEAAHCPMETHPVEFNQYIIEWLKSIEN